MRFKTATELQAIAEDLRSTADTLAEMLDQLIPDSDLMKDVFLRWPRMIRDAADKLAPRPRPWEAIPAWPEGEASEDEIWQILLRRLDYWKSREQDPAGGVPR